MHRSDHIKSDGRRLWLYARDELLFLKDQSVPSPSVEPVVVSTHMRWHPVMGEWVVYAGHRQNRTFLPPADSNPLAPTLDPQRPTELPDTHYDVAVFENRFPSLAAHPGEAPAIADVLARPALGRCEVVVFARNADMSLARLSVDHIALIMEVWADRTKEMRANGIKYVLPFENRGVEMGVTLHHPHGQIYGYGFLPAQQRRASENLMGYRKEHGKNLIADLVFSERASGTRLIRDHGKAIAFVPPFARFPYEAWVVPERHVEDLAGLDAEERHAMAATLKDVLQRLDALWDRPMPYLLTVNQAPTDGNAHPEWTMRIEIWPIRRAAEKLKFLAGTELGAGVFVSDIAPEVAAANLRAVKL